MARLSLSTVGLSLTPVEQSLSRARSRLALVRLSLSTIRAEPDSGRVEPVSGQVEADHSQAQLFRGQVELDAGKVEPDLGQIVADHGQTPSFRGQVEPSAGQIGLSFLPHGFLPHLGETGSGPTETGSSPAETRSGPAEAGSGPGEPDSGPAEAGFGPGEADGLKRDADDRKGEADRRKRADCHHKLLWDATSLQNATTASVGSSEKVPLGEGATQTERRTPPNPPALTALAPRQPRCSRHRHHLWPYGWCSRPLVGRSPTLTTDQRSAQLGHQVDLLLPDQTGRRSQSEIQAEVVTGGCQPPTNGRAGGKLPAGKIAARSPARSFSAASR